jgi:hypothetical protein
MTRIGRVSTGLLCAVALPGFASDGQDHAAQPPAPIDHPAPGSTQDDGGSPDDPRVTVREFGETTIEEYRVGGELYMIKIVPRKGVPYYLVDSDGDGSFERRANDREPRLLIPSWVLLRWR